MNMQSDPPDDDTIRLQLAIARAGVASRRHAEELIAAGRVKVNGAVVSAMGARVTPGRDTVEVDGRPIPAQPLERVTVLLNKPAGWLSAASDGVKRIAVPMRATLTDVFTGETMPGNETYVDIDMKFGETSILRIEPMK